MDLLTSAVQCVGTWWALSHRSLSVSLSLSLSHSRSRTSSLPNLSSLGSWFMLTNQMEMEMGNMLLKSPLLPVPTQLSCVCVELSSIVYRLNIEMQFHASTNWHWGKYAEICAKQLKFNCHQHQFNGLVLKMANARGEGTDDSRQTPDVWQGETEVEREGERKLAA